MLVGFAVGMLGGLPLIRDHALSLKLAFWQHEARATEWQKKLNDKVRLFKDVPRHK